MWGIFEVFADTIIVCTLTALTILSSGAVDLTTGQLTGEAAAIESSSLVSYAFGNHFGFWAQPLWRLRFCFSRILRYWGGAIMERQPVSTCSAPAATKIYRMGFAVIVLAGSVMKAQLAWDISDTFNGLMCFRT